MKGKILLTIMITLFLGRASFGLNMYYAIKMIKRGSAGILKKISYKDMKKLHVFEDKYYYIPRFIGQRSLRSLLGCLKNSDDLVRKLCADNLYQLKLTFIHKKLLIFYWRKENHIPTKLALQDLLVRITDDRFIRAREGGDSNFLAKISYDEISEFVEKDTPPGDKYNLKDFLFLKGGINNEDSRIKLYSIKMLGRITDNKGRVLVYLNSLKNVLPKNRQLARELEISIKCQKSPESCPDLNPNE